MKLKLSKPLIFFDLETTGLNITKDHIVELCYVKVWPNGNEETKTLRINPGVHIPEESSRIHGITDDDVKDCPTFKEVAAGVAAAFVNSDIAGFNSSHFDVPMLCEEMARVGVDMNLNDCRFVDVQNIYHKLEPRTLSAAYRFYCGKNLDDAHSAAADTRATYEVLQAQLDRYPETLKNDVAFLADFSRRNKNVDLAGRMVYNDQGVEVFNFGKFKGMPVAQVLQRDPGYYGWMLRGDFPQNTKQVLQRLYFKYVKQHAAQ